MDLLRAQVDSLRAEGSSFGRSPDFNEASRGPFGALSLILHIRWGATIASLGALLMILALAQDTFYQAIYSTYTDLTSQASEVATLAKSNCFDSRTLEAGYSELAMSPMY